MISVPPGIRAPKPASFGRSMGFRMRSNSDAGNRDSMIPGSCMMSTRSFPIASSAIRMSRDTHVRLRSGAADRYCTISRILGGGTNLKADPLTTVVLASRLYSTPRTSAVPIGRLPSVNERRDPTLTSDLTSPETSTENDRRPSPKPPGGSSSASSSSHSPITTSFPSNPGKTHKGR